MNTIPKSTIQSIGGVHGTPDGQEASVLESHKESLLNTTSLSKNSEFLLNTLFFVQKFEQWLLPPLSQICQILLHLHQNTSRRTVDIKKRLPLLLLPGGHIPLHIAVASPT